MKKYRFEQTDLLYWVENGELMVGSKLAPGYQSESANSMEWFRKGLRNGSLKPIDSGSHNKRQYVPGM